MASWDRIIDVDLVGTVDLLENARPHLKSGGSAVCIASMSAYLVPPDEAIDKALSFPLAEDFPAQLQSLASSSPAIENSGFAYAYAKRALKQYVTSRASSWASEGKRLVSISPGLINTAMGQLEISSMDKGEAMLDGIALKRFGEAEDIANCALFLVSEKAAYITGCDILVDGGFVAKIGEQQQQGPS
jgi:NAD(P)-dependent dehydrogenase (short-subunit alcohol dehydrogenase family)